MRTRSTPRNLTLPALAIMVLMVARGEAFAGQSTKSDAHDELKSLVHEYTSYEDAGDMVGQAKLMVPDRWWHGIGGRRTDNELYMKMQQQLFSNARKRYPGVTFMREVRDLETRLVAPTVAITSFTWFVNRLIPPDLPADKVQALGPAPIPNTVSLIWVRQAEGWRIISTHMSPLYLRP